MTDTIETPRGAIFTTKYGKATLVWNTDFRPKWQKRYTDAQVFVDNEVLRRSEPFVPLLTGMLIMSGILGTEIGSGTVQWIAPYAKGQYYRGRREGRSSTGPLRGRLWFERGKEVWGKTVIAGAKKIAATGEKK